MFIPPAQMSGNTLKRAIYLTHKRKRSPNTERCLSQAMFIVFFHHQHWPLKYPTANERPKSKKDWAPPLISIHVKISITIKRHTCFCLV